MTYSPPQPPVSAHLARRASTVSNSGRMTVRTGRTTMKTRKYDIAFLDPAGLVQETSRVAPALPVFESGFAAFARGSLILTDAGYVAVEDLQPGMMVQTLDHGSQPLIWIGSTLLIPGAEGQIPEMGRLTRLTTDSLGLGRPMPDLLLGPYARIHNRSATCTALLGSAGGMTPGLDYEDGENVISVTPLTPVRLYHLAFARHQLIRVNGVDLESSHPGLSAIRALGHEMRALLLSLYPHHTSAEGFGPFVRPRYSIEDMDDRGAA